MAKDILGEAGLHFDELNKLRVLDPEVSQQTTELKEECKDFVDKIGQFQKIVGGLLELVDQLAKEAENEKMKAIGARNLLKSIAKQREAQQQQLQALIAEKKMQLERNELKISLYSRRVEKQKNLCTIPVTNDPSISCEMVCEGCIVSEGNKTNLGLGACSRCQCISGRYPATVVAQVLTSCVLILK
ncbi:PREDICTED: intraflagellar transport protein 20 homolog isoform X2 [Myotis davidii]|nr:PREDICTED: intraflagellar transport protein 20 homolog isoform X2 [Myotis davidii]XP_015422202.1 PREDICTED: intraflagellar transport protein 20 homolog isoform X2 [Myotis davidii]